MSHSVTTTHYNQEHVVLHAEDLDVWVAYDGGTVIVIQGPVAGDSDDSGADSGAPAGNSSPDETENTAFTVIAGTNWPSTGDLTQSTTPTATQSSVELSTITQSTNLPTLISESQAPSTSGSLETSETQSRMASSIVISSSTETLTMAPVSLPTSPSISIVASAEPSSTGAAPPLSTSSEYLSHSPPFFVAIVLGCIAGVAVLGALIAWALRKQAHERHQRLIDSAAKLPWFSADRNDDGLVDPTIASDVETAMQTTNTEVGIMNLGSREDMAYLQSWEPRGDRDVGEPKRSEYYDRKPRPPFITQQIPSYALFSRYSGQQFISNATASPCSNRVSLGSIDPHCQTDTLGKGSALLITNQVPGDMSVSSSREIGFFCPSRSSMTPQAEIGTPRELVPMPRFLGLDGKGLTLPWEEKASSSTQGPPERKTKSRIMSAEHIRKTWDRHPSNLGETPSTSNQQLERELEPAEGWANSIKSNFFNAFNAVTASLPITAIKEGKDSTESHFTPARPKRSLQRKGLRDSAPIQGQDEVDSKSALSRGCTIKSSESHPWSLVQTGSHTGIVHIHLPTSDACSILSHKTSDPKFAVARAYTLHGTEPLQIKKKLSVSFSKGPPSISSKDSRVRAPFSRGSSTGGSVSPKRHRKSPGGSMKRKITLDRRSSLLFSRTTSMASSSSTVSIVTGAQDMKEKRLLARDALKDRRRKAKGLKETPVE